MSENVTCEQCPNKQIAVCPGYDKCPYLFAVDLRQERDAARARVAKLEADTRALMDVIGETQADLDDALRENKRLREIMAASLRVDCTAECRAEVGAKEGER